MKSRNKYIKMIDQYSRLAIKCVVICLFVIIIVQTILQVNSIRQRIVPTERWEGEHIQSTP
ncbi:MAG: hypothetical protein NAG76_20340 [Candidatus Pristimantibacillus lignocellulolyticus]|uniref:Uncharacterized protein n=1 Tax=Candidatus Pristimantibacillus lignocellulolyticus TaxID=2994561 RepID=A0A9J6ZEB0_9BACL|nr:MAG: hypothetical protein NAG76_20340 [Candidatus Pristimantibacillus lignocellulolyticus]